MLTLLEGGVVKPAGYLPPCLSDKSVASSPINYGHNIEAAWLLQHVASQSGAAPRRRASALPRFCAVVVVWKVVVLRRCWPPLRLLVRAQRAPALCAPQL